MKTSKSKAWKNGIGYFSNEIDIMILGVKFDQILNDKIKCETKITFTNRDKFFEGTYDQHAEKSITFKTELSIEPLVYLDYHNLIVDKDRLAENLNSRIYDLQKIEVYDFGWKDGDMKAYRIGFN